jgi:16S rRNA (guanine966-N2)-methyltransferase
MRYVPGVRIVGGSLSGRVLRAPAGAATRPTSEKVREAVFNILGNIMGSVEGDHVLDLFAGSGALGIEALSRGARAAVFVESGAAAVRTLRANLTRTGFAPCAEVLPLGMRRALRAFARRGRAVDGIVADPPYGAGWPTRTIREVLAAGVLAPEGWIALEHRVDEPVESGPSLVLVQRRRYGRTALTLLARPAEGT